MVEKDFLIIGQGLAGSLLAYFLLQKQKQILIADNSHKDSASMVAAGIFNPITGKKNKKSWNADEIFPIAQKTYQELELLFNAHFYHLLPLKKYFTNLEDQENWLQKGHLDLESFYQGIENKPPDNFKNSEFYGGINIHQSGYLEIPKLLNCFSEFFAENGLLIQEKYLHDDMILMPNHVVWKGIRFKKVIFCEGHHIAINPFFSWIPMVPAKGQLITIYAEKLNLKTIAHRDIFILPQGNNYYKVGATYEWEYNHPLPTEQGKDYLLSKLNKVIDCPYVLTEQKAGIRPTTLDRMPVAGFHPVYPTLGLINGLGTKGVSLAPYMALKFIGNLINVQPLPKEISIDRFVKKYYKEKSLDKTE